MRLLQYIWRFAIRIYIRLKMLLSFRKVSTLIKRSRKLNIPLAVIFGTPEHSNIGDIAIEWAERRFISKRKPSYLLVSIPVEVMARYFDQIRMMIQPVDLLLGHGGGNMGDTYPMEEEFRRRVISEFLDNRIITFPQTVYFSNSSFGKEELKKTQAVYAMHPNLTLIARETVSYEYMKAKFKNNHVILTPDIVLSSDMYKTNINRSGALACLRSDKESVLTPADRSKVIDFLSQKYKKVTSTDTVSYSPFFTFMDKNRVLSRKLKQFSSSEFVITDRLHGMVFAAITGTPCIALTNFNHKVLGTYGWIEKLQYVRFCNNISDIRNVYKEMTAKPGLFESREFDVYWNEIIDSIEGKN